MKALVCDTCLRANLPLIEFRILTEDTRTQKSHLCPRCMEQILRRTNRTTYGAPNTGIKVPTRSPRHEIDIPIEDK